MVLSIDTSLLLGNNCTPSTIFGSGSGEEEGKRKKIREWGSNRFDLFLIIT